MILILAWIYTKKKKMPQILFAAQYIVSLKIKNKNK